MNLVRKIRLYGLHGSQAVCGLSVFVQYVPPVLVFRVLAIIIKPILLGGNRPRLESSGNVIEDCDIYRYGRVSIIGKDALKISGVGNLVRYNNIHDASPSAIRYYVCIFIFNGVLYQG